MRLWLAEKADAGRKIAAALGGGRESNGAVMLAGGDVVTWARGNLIQNYMPEDYDDRYKKWDVRDLPILPPKMLRKPDPARREVLDRVVGLIDKADEVIIATDAGREGEAIGWSILDYAGWRGPTKRFWTTAQNDSHLRKAVNHLLDAKEKKPLYISAKIRSSIDWSDGLSWTRYYSQRSGNMGDEVLSVGRVQTATLAIIVDRDLEIENFKPETYYEMRATMDTSVGRLELEHRPSEDKPIPDRKAAEEIARKGLGQTVPLKMDNKAKSFAPPLPFSLPELQMVTPRLWGWTAKKTLEVLQDLYLKGAVTYPRTDHGQLPQEMVADMPRHLSALRQRSAYAKMADIKPIIHKHVFDSSKLDDHHGIIPTDECVDIRGLGADAGKLFDLIARRFLAALMPNAKGATTTISARIDGLLYKTSGTIITVPGWKSVWRDEDDVAIQKKGEDQERRLPPVTDGMPAKVAKLDVLEKTTRPPARFNEASLIKAMISVGAKNKDAEIRELLSNGGLGTKSTRQDIIEKIKSRLYVSADGTKLISTLRGREFIAVLRKDGNRLADVMATVDLERELREIEKDPSKALDIWNRYTATIRSEMERLRSGPAPRRMTPCPRKSKDAPRGSGAGSHRGRPSSSSSTAAKQPAKVAAKKPSSKTTTRRPRAATKKTTAGSGPRTALKKT